MRTIIHEKFQIGTFLITSMQQFSGKTNIHTSSMMENTIDLMTKDFKLIKVIQHSLDLVEFGGLDVNHQIWRQREVLPQLIMTGTIMMMIMRTMVILFSQDFFKRKMKL